MRAVDGPTSCALLLGAVVGTAYHNKYVYLNWVFSVISFLGAAAMYQQGEFASLLPLSSGFLLIRLYIAIANTKLHDESKDKKLYKVCAGRIE